MPARAATSCRATPVAKDPLQQAARLCRLLSYRDPEGTPNNILTRGVVRHNLGQLCLHTLIGRMPKKLMDEIRRHTFEQFRERPAPRPVKRRVTRKHTR